MIVIPKYSIGASPGGALEAGCFKRKAEMRHGAGQRGSSGA